MNKMLKLVFFIFSCELLSTGHAMLGKEIFYQLDNSYSRTSVVIEDGSVKIKFMAFRDDKLLGPVYDLKVDYDFNIRVYGQERGTINMSLPEYMVDESLYKALRTRQATDLDMQGFKMGFLGMSMAKINGEDQECSFIRIFDIDLDRLTGTKHEVLSALKNLVVHLKIKPQNSTVDVAEIDITGAYKTAIPYGISYQPNIPFGLGLNLVETIAPKEKNMLDMFKSWGAKYF
jgi:hypothetical protein